MSLFRISKKKILKGIDESIYDQSCSVIDCSLDADDTQCIKDDVIDRMNAKISRLKEIRKELEELLT